MHIVFVSRELGIYKNTGGIGTYVWDIARRMVQMGHKCTVVCSSYDPLRGEEEMTDGVRIIKLPDDQLSHCNKFQYFLNFKRNFIAYRKRIADCLETLLEREHIDIIEFAEYGVESLIWHRKPRRVPLVIRWHTPIGKQIKLKNLIYYPIRRWTDSLVKGALFTSDLITFPSKWMADRVKEKIALNNLSYQIIPNGINYSDWQMQDGNSLKKQKTKTGSIEILFVGTLEARKGFVDLIAAAKYLRSEGLNINLTLVGKHSRYSQRILSRERCNIESGWLKVIGAIPRNQLASHYMSADICCFPSWFETVGIVCLEAMACGRIVIGSSNSGMAEVIRDGIDGFLAEPKNPKTLAGCIKKVMHLSEDQKENIQQQARKRILENYDNSVVIPQMIASYGQVLEKWQLSH